MIVLNSGSLSFFVNAHTKLLYDLRSHHTRSPEPHILLFRRPLGTDPQSGRVDPELARVAREEYKDQFGLRH